MTGPKLTETHPMKGFDQVCYLKNVIRPPISSWEITAIMMIRSIQRGSRETCSTTILSWRTS